MSRTKDDIAHIYATLKERAGGTPLLYRAFLKQSGIPRRELQTLFGASAYSKLQQFAGDSPNGLELKATPLSQIMANYGRLALDVFNREGRLPFAAEWIHRGLRPTESGLSKVHGIRWSEFPEKFAAHCEKDPAFAAPFEKVLNVIKDQLADNKSPVQHPIDILIDRVSEEIRKWSPAVRRNSEEAYKSELSLHLRNSPMIQRAGLQVREERGDSQCDIALGTKIALELKKAPMQSDYDRCFGQIARHLETYDRVIVLIFDVPSRDRFEDFNSLVDHYFKQCARVIRDG